MLLIVMLVCAAAAHVYERVGGLEAIITALSLALIFSLAEAYD
ncbi:MAG: hypothetical protein JWN07_2877 [Hyphomicrobiales bacterium]|nr:hypothetical protein [Hyphomicrobiales bacterium]